MNVEHNSFMADYIKTDDILKDMCGIIETSRETAYKAINAALVERNWLIGYRISVEDFSGEERSEYGLQMIKKLSKELISIYGEGYDRSNLYHYLRFYKKFPKIILKIGYDSRKITVFEKNSDFSIRE